MTDDAKKPSEMTNRELARKWADDCLDDAVAETRVVNVKRENCEVFIGRPSKWGNPFKIGRDGSRAEVIAKYRNWLASQVELLGDLDELRGKTLGCYCSPEPCHGDVLAGLADADEENVTAICDECETPMRVVFRGGVVVRVFKVCKCDTPAERMVSRNRNRR